MKRDELEQCLRGWKVRLRDSAHDVEEIQRRFYASKGAAAVRSLEKNGFAAHYAARYPNLFRLVSKHCFILSIIQYPANSRNPSIGHLV